MNRSRRAGTPTRAERQARTREQLLLTAEEMFLAHGYVRVRLSEVAQRAGYSTGAVYANYRGKAELGLAVLDRVRAREVAGLARAIEAAREDGSPSPQALLAAIGSWAQRVLDDGTWFRLELEFALEARSEPDLVAELATRQRRLHRDLADAVTRHLPEPMAEAMAGVETTHVAALVTLGVGLAVQRMVDPQVTARPLVRSLEALLAPGPTPLAGR